MKFTAYRSGVLMSSGFEAIEWQILPLTSITGKEERMLLQIIGTFDTVADVETFANRMQSLKNKLAKGTVIKVVMIERAAVKEESTDELVRKVIGQCGLEVTAE